MNRRGFLGSVLGLVAGGPFLVKTFEQPIQRIVLPDWRMYFRTRDGLLLQAPGVTKIKEVQFGYSWVAEPLEVTQTVIMRSVVLYNSKGELIKESPFSADVPMCSGDTLKCEQALTLGNTGIIVKSPEHLAALFVATGGKDVDINDPCLKGLI